MIRKCFKIIFFVEKSIRIRILAETHRIVGPKLAIIMSAKKNKGSIIFHRAGVVEKMYIIEGPSFLQRV